MDVSDARMQGREKIRRVMIVRLRSGGANTCKLSDAKLVMGYGFEGDRDGGKNSFKTLCKLECMRVALTRRFHKAV